MGYIQINSIGLSFTPSVNQTVTVSYRVAADADIPSNYVVWDNAAVVQPNGVFLTPVVITSLTDGESYVVRIVNNCGGAGVQQLYNVPAGTTIPGTTQPVTTMAITTLPVTTPPATTQPVTTPPVTTPPPTTVPATTPPVTTAPVTTPVPTTEPATTAPATTIPPTEPVTTIAPTTPPVTTEPVTTPAATTPPVTTEPVTTPAPTTVPVTTEPVTTPAATTPPVTTEPVTTPVPTTVPVTTPPVTTTPATTATPTTTAEPYCPLITADDSDVYSGPKPGGDGTHYIMITELVLDPVYSGPGNPQYPIRAWWRLASDPDIEGSYNLIGDSNVFVGSPFPEVDPAFALDDEDGLPIGEPIIIRLQLLCREEFYYTEPIELPGPTTLEVGWEYPALGGNLSVSVDGGGGGLTPPTVTASNGGTEEASGVLVPGDYDFFFSTTVDNQSGNYLVNVIQNGTPVAGYPFTGDGTQVAGTFTIADGDIIRFELVSA